MKNSHEPFGSVPRKQQLPRLPTMLGGENSGSCLQEIYTQHTHYTHMSMKNKQERGWPESVRCRSIPGASLAHFWFLGDSANLQALEEISYEGFCQLAGRSNLPLLAVPRGAGCPVVADVLSIRTSEAGTWSLCCWPGGGGRCTRSFHSSSPELSWTSFEGELILVICISSGQ